MNEDQDQSNGQTHASGEDTKTKPRLDNIVTFDEIMNMENADDEAERQSAQD